MKNTYLKGRQRPKVNGERFVLKKPPVRYRYPYKQFMEIRNGLVDESIIELIEIDIHWFKEPTSFVKEEICKKTQQYSNLKHVLLIIFIRGTPAGALK